MHQNYFANANSLQYTNGLHNNLEEIIIDNLIINTTLCNCTICNVSIDINQFQFLISGNSTRGLCYLVLMFPLNFFSLIVWSILHIILPRMDSQLNFQSKIFQLNSNCLSRQSFTKLTLFDFLSPLKTFSLQLLVIEKWNYILI